jgi:hypothetical protein
VQMNAEDLIAYVRPRRNTLIDRLAACLTISDARWDGDEQTVVHIDRLLPSLQSVENDEDHAKARWHLRTAKPLHLYGFPAPPAALGAWVSKACGGVRRV